jgi:hypothetical protein
LQFRDDLLAERFVDVKHPDSKYAVVLAGFLISLFCTQAGLAQSPTLQQKVAQAKQLLIANKQQLARYTWQMQETVSVRGDVKSQTVYQVQLGSNGQPVKTVLSQSSSGGTQRQFGIRHRIEENYKEYAQQVGSLAQSYAQLSPARVGQLYAQGQVTLRSAGASDYAEIVVSNYAKSGDSVVLTIRANPKALVSYYVSSYLSGPSDGVTMMVRFSSLPDGTRYASTVTVNGQSKSLTITDHSHDFEPRG